MTNEKAREVLQEQIDKYGQEYDVGELSDGYHTFNQLYYQRAVLFACIVKQNKNKAWKSFKHSDGRYCFDRNGEWFIVGVDTPQGSYTYHYAKEYWDMFDCQELERGKEWDGHTEKDVTRLLSLEPHPCDDAVSRQAVLDAIDTWDKFGYTETGCFIRNPKGDYVPYIYYDDVIKCIKNMPPVTPSIKDWLSSFNINSATACFTAVQELKKEIENGCIGKE